MRRFSYRFNEIEARTLMDYIGERPPHSFNENIVAARMMAICEKTVEGPWCPPYALPTERIKTFCYLLGYKADEKGIAVRRSRSNYPYSHSPDPDDGKEHPILGNFFKSVEKFLQGSENAQVEAVSILCQGCGRSYRPEGGVVNADGFFTCRVCLVGLKEETHFQCCDCKKILPGEGFTLQEIEEADIVQAFCGRCSKREKCTVCEKEFRASVLADGECPDCRH